MRRSLLITTAIAALAFSYGTASAQSVGVEVYTGPRYEMYPYGDHYQHRPGTRVYGYYQENDEPRIMVRPSNCGQFRYWNGKACVDARVTPPDLR